MQPVFEDTVVDSNDELRTQLGDRNLLITIVHEGSGTQDFEDAIPDSFEDERFIRVNLANCSESGRRYWTSMNSFEAELFEMPDRTEHPVPFLDAYMPCDGHLDRVHDATDVASVLEVARKNKADILKMRESVRRMEQAGESVNQTTESSE